MDKANWRYTNSTIKQFIRNHLTLILDTPLLLSNFRLFIGIFWCCRMFIGCCLLTFKHRVDVINNKFTLIVLTVSEILVLQTFTY